MLAQNVLDNSKKFLRTRVFGDSSCGFSKLTTAVKVLCGMEIPGEDPASSFGRNLYSNLHRVTSF